MKDNASRNFPVDWYMHSRFAYGGRRRKMTLLLQKKALWKMFRQYLTFAGANVRPKRTNARSERSSKGVVFKLKVAIPLRG